MTAHLEKEPESATRAAGVVIILSAIASIGAVALDSMAEGNDPLSILQGMVKIQQSHQLVHVVAMACVAGLMFGYTVLSQRLGLRRPSVLAGLLAYGFGSMLMLVATVIDGFISTDVAALFATKSPEAVRAGYWMVQTMAGVALPDIARVAWVFQSVAAIAWALALLRDAGLSRKVGMVGLVAGTLPAVALFVVGANMTESVVLGILLLQAIWNIAAATWLLRSGVRAEAPAPRLAHA